MPTKKVIYCKNCGKSLLLDDIVGCPACKKLRKVIDKTGCVYLFEDPKNFNQKELGKLFKNWPIEIQREFAFALSFFRSNNGARVN
jgi:hypothetical protein